MNDKPEGTESQLQFTIVNHRARQGLGLTMMEYCVIDSIYNLSNNPKYKGWCVISKEHLADFLNCSLTTVKDAIRTGMKKGLIKKPDTKKSYHDTRKVTTQLWYDTVIMNKSNGAKSDSNGAKIAPSIADNGAKIAPYNDNDNNDSNKDNDTKIESLFKEFKTPLKDRLIWKAVYKNEKGYLLRQLLYAKKKDKTSVKWIQAALNDDYESTSKEAIDRREKESWEMKERENCEARSGILHDITEGIFDD